MAWLLSDLQLETPPRLRGLASKAGARWLFSAGFATLFFLFLYAYHYDGFQSSVLPGWLSGGSTSPFSSSPSIAQLPRRPAWIDTPPAFDAAAAASSSSVAVGTASLDRPLALHPLLAKAAEAFLARPVLEHGDARAQNEAACPRAQLDRQVNADQLKGDRARWVAVGAGRIVAMRRAAVTWLEERSAKEGEEALIGPGFTVVEEEEEEDGAGGGGGEEETEKEKEKRKVRRPVKRGSRGVVFAAGNHRTVEKTIICIREMQKLGWKKEDGIGLEVFHFEGEMDNAKLRAELEGLGATIRMVSLKKTPGQWKNFELKAESILRSSFDEVLYLDSDNFPLSDISRLFDAALFKDPKGGNAVFWPDLNRDHPDNAIHRLLGIPCHDAWELDSGQMLITKSGNGGLNLAALYLAQHMAETEDERYWFSGGDKDTFRYAFLALGLPYTPAPRWLSFLGNLGSRGTSVFFCGAAMLQYGLEPPRSAYRDPVDPTHPEPLFVHANLLKHMSGARPGNVFNQLRRLAPDQDDVRVEWPAGTALHGVAGGAREVAARGLCGDVWAFTTATEGGPSGRAGATRVETLETKNVYGGLMEKFEAGYFGNKGTRPGIWR